jgi:hypothetical protein
MAYRRPPLFTRLVVNPLAMKFGIAGTKTLAVRRRLSGKTQRVPLVPIEYGGARYLVSPRGETDWVRNLRSAGGDAELCERDKTVRLQATEVPVADRAPILATYQEVAGRVVASHFQALPDPADHPVFRIESR